MIAIFTHHDTTGEKAGRNDFQNQSIAYSVDEGKTWIKYAGNPVLKNPGIADFRDPKVMWYAPQKKWIMTLATKSYISFYSSPDLKNWSKESEFGKTVGAHGGVWECPDLIALDDNGKQRWVLIVNLNPGAPNGGSGTQYFIGDFDGKNFTSNQTEPRWMDYGPDNYAGITWSNTGKRKVLIGWMSNWNYATLVPTKNWRSAMTLPRDLTLKHAGDKILLSSQLIHELGSIELKPILIENITVKKQIDLVKKMGKLGLPCRINLAINQLNDFSIILSNKLGEELVIGFDKTANQYFIDRTKSGKINFNKDFAGRHVAPRFADIAKINLSLVIDASSVELFADDGLTVMTEIFFPNEPYTQIRLQSNDGVKFGKIEYIGLKKIRK
jgi:fructan beta-fructosidase